MVTQFGETPLAREDIRPTTKESDRKVTQDNDFVIHMTRVYFWYFFRLQVQEAGVSSHPAFLDLGDFVLLNKFLQRPRILGAIIRKHH